MLHDLLDEIRYLGKAPPNALLESLLPWSAQIQKIVKHAEIYWCDETGVSNCEIVERGFSPKGHPSVLTVETKRQRVNMISAISSHGNVRFMVNQETMNQ